MESCRLQSTRSVRSTELLSSSTVNRIKRESILPVHGQNDFICSVLWKWTLMSERTLQHSQSVARGGRGTSNTGLKGAKSVEYDDNVVRSATNKDRRPSASRGSPRRGKQSDSDNLDSLGTVTTSQSTYGSIPASSIPYGSLSSQMVPTSMYDEHATPSMGTFEPADSQGSLLLGQEENGQQDYGSNLDDSLSLSQSTLAKFEDLCVHSQFVGWLRGFQDYFLPSSWSCIERVLLKPRWVSIRHFLGFRSLHICFLLFSGSVKPKEAEVQAQVLHRIVCEHLISELFELSPSEVPREWERNLLLFTTPSCDKPRKRRRPAKSKGESSDDSESSTSENEEEGSDLNYEGRLLFRKVSNASPPADRSGAAGPTGDVGDAGPVYTGPFLFDSQQELSTTPPSGSSRAIRATAVKKTKEASIPVLGEDQRPIFRSECSATLSVTTAKPVLNVHLSGSVTFDPRTGKQMATELGWCHTGGYANISLRFLERLCRKHKIDMTYELGSFHVKRSSKRSRAQSSRVSANIDTKPKKSPRYRSRNLGKALDIPHSIRMYIVENENDKDTKGHPVVADGTKLPGRCGVQVAFFTNPTLSEVAQQVVDEEVPLATLTDLYPHIGSALTIKYRISCILKLSNASQSNSPSFPLRFMRKLMKGFDVGVKSPAASYDFLYAHSSLDFVQSKTLETELVSESRVCFQGELQFVESSKLPTDPALEDSALHEAQNNMGNSSPPHDPCPEILLTTPRTCAGKRLVNLLPPKNHRSENKHRFYDVFISFDGEVARTAATQVGRELRKRLPTLSVFVDDDRQPLDETGSSRIPKGVRRNIRESISSALFSMRFGVAIVFVSEGTLRKTWPASELYFLCKLWKAGYVQLFPVMVNERCSRFPSSKLINLFGLKDSDLPTSQKMESVSLEENNGKLIDDECTRVCKTAVEEYLDFHELIGDNRSDALAAVSDKCTGSEVLCKNVSGFGLRMNVGPRQTVSDVFTAAWGNGSLSEENVIKLQAVAENMGEREVAKLAERYHLKYVEEYKLHFPSNVVFRED